MTNRISSGLIFIDNTADYLPLVSTAINLVDLFQKYAVMPLMQKQSVWNNHYYTHLSQKNAIRCLVLLIPAIGNFLVGVYDFVCRQYNDKAYMLAAMQQDASIFKNASAQLKDDKEFVLAAVKLYDSNLRYASERLRNDKEIVLATIFTNDSWAVKYASKELLDDKDVALATVKITGCAIQYFSERLQNDREVAMTATLNTIDALFYCKQFTNDREFMLQVFREIWGSGEYIYERLKEAFHYRTNEQLKNNRDFILDAIKEVPFLLAILGPEYQDDEEIVLAAIKKRGLMLEYVSTRLRTKKNIILTAIAQEAQAMIYVPYAARRNFALAIVNQNGLLLNSLSEDRKNDLEIVLAAVNQNGLALQFAGEWLKNDSQVVEAAARSNKAALQFAHRDAYDRYVSSRPVESILIPARPLPANRNNLRSH